MQRGRDVTDSQHVSGNEDLPENQVCRAEQHIHRRRDQMPALRYYFLPLALLLFLLILILILLFHLSFLTSAPTKLHAASSRLRSTRRSCDSSSRAVLQTFDAHNRAFVARPADFTPGITGHDFKKEQFPFASEITRGGGHASARRRRRGVGNVQVDADRQFALGKVRPEQPGTGDFHEGDHPRRGQDGGECILRVER